MIIGIIRGGFRAKQPDRGAFPGSIAITGCYRPYIFVMIYAMGYFLLRWRFLLPSGHINRWQHCRWWCRWWRFDVGCCRLLAGFRMRTGKKNFNMFHICDHGSYLWLGRGKALGNEAIEGKLGLHQMLYPYDWVGCGGVIKIQANLYPLWTTSMIRGIDRVWGAGLGPARTRGIGWGGGVWQNAPTNGGIGWGFFGYRLWLKPQAGMIQTSWSRFGWKLLCTIW